MMIKYVIILSAKSSYFPFRKGGYGDLKGYFRMKKRFALLFIPLLLYLSQFAMNYIAFAAEQGVLIPEEVTEIWSERYKTKGFVFGTRPVKFLKENIKILPKGRVFDLAMGEGRNAVYLAKNGFEVEGCDISSTAIEKAQKLAEKKGVKIKAFVADLAKYEIRKDYYDVITCFYYLQRNIIPQIKEGLKMGGMVIFETYTVDQLKLGPDVKGPKNKDYLLKHNELLDFFRDFRIILYEETVIDNKKAVARIIAEKIIN